MALPLSGVKLSLKIGLERRETNGTQSGIRKDWFIMAPVRTQWSKLQTLSTSDAASKAFVQAVFQDGQGLWAV